MKSITIWHLDGIKTLEELMSKVKTEFKDIPHSDIKVTFGYVNVHLEYIPSPKQINKQEQL